MESRFILMCALTFLGVGLCNAAFIYPRRNITADNANALTNKTESLDDILGSVFNLISSKIHSLLLSFQEELEVSKDNRTRALWKFTAPNICPKPLAPENGGLVCVHTERISYCKPMCNQGYDFAFLRRSRLYEECGRHTDFSWTTQYLGGNRLAECLKFPSAVSGNFSAYFSDETCQQVANSAESKRRYKNEFIQELRLKNIDVKHKRAFITCGE